MVQDVLLLIERHRTRILHGYSAILGKWHKNHLVVHTSCEYPCSPLYHVRCYFQHKNAHRDASAYSHLVSCIPDCSHFFGERFKAVP